MKLALKKIGKAKLRPCRVVIMGMDTFRQKNIAQLELMNKRNFIFDVFTNDSLGDSKEHFCALLNVNRLIDLKKGFLSRMKQLVIYFFHFKEQIHHVEVYSGGRFACFYGLLCQCFNLKYIVVERGDLKSIIDGYRLKLMYSTVPTDVQIKSNIVYLYIVDGIITYAIRNKNEFVERIHLSSLPTDVLQGLTHALASRVKKLNLDQEKAIFKITSEKDHTLNELPWLYRLVFQYVYKFSSLVWYKEPYMESLLKKMGLKHYSMIANAVDVPDLNNGVKKDIDFLWVNRVVHRRNFEWVVHHFYDKVMLKTVALGYTNKHSESLLPDTITLLDDLQQKEHFELHGYINPVSFFERAKFFVLPATFVFGNYSLLEAMSYGVVPVVSETDATSRIVQNNVNGITFNHDYESFTDAINRAISLDENTYNRMSERAKQSIEQDFSLPQWANKIESLYSTLHV